MPNKHATGQTLKITVLIGNPKASSRTGSLACRLAEAAFSCSRADLDVIELTDYATDLLAWPSDPIQALKGRIASCDVLIVASPTFKATYTGMLKLFFDSYPQNGLSGTVAIAFMTGSGQGHSLAPTASLVPLLLELGATVPVQGLFFDTDKIEHSHEILQQLTCKIRNGFSTLAPIVQAAAFTTTRNKE